MPSVNLDFLRDVPIATSTLANLAIVTPRSTGFKPNQDLSDQKTQERFVFDYEGNNDMSFSSSVTTHYLENNFSAQDHVSINPVVINVQGFVGELTSFIQDGGAEAFDLVESKLTEVSGLFPRESGAALEVLNAAQQVRQSVNIARQFDIDKLVERPFINKKQSAAVLKLYDHWRNRTIFDVATPWAIHKSMVITDCSFSQKDGDNLITECNLTFTELRILGADSSDAPNLVSEITNRQSAERVNKGSTNGQLIE